MTVKVTGATSSTTMAAQTQPILKNGSTGAAVTKLQQNLKAAGYDPGPIDGDFGPKTEAAVKGYQQAQGLKADGIVGPKTWNKLANSSAPSTSPSSQPTLKQGSKGAAVKVLQQKLAAAGYSAGAIDGSFGAKTKAALIAFQEANGLSANGVCGPQTWTALNAAKPTTPTSTLSSAQRERIISIAGGEVGLKEKGKNGGPILKYPNYFGRGAEAWCADFASWVYTKAGVPLNNPSCSNLVSKLKASGKWKTGNPQPGDMVFFDWVKGSGARGSGISDHVGIVVSVNRDGSVNTIEGNAKGPGGVQGVFRHTRSSGILGYSSL
jgi:peptidoglycan hydrolase-like protein with peptidoglycan-binding domain